VDERRKECKENILRECEWKKKPGCPMNTGHDQVNQILESGNVKLQNNRRVCMRQFMKLNEASLLGKGHIVLCFILSLPLRRNNEMVS